MGDKNQAVIYLCSNCDAQFPKWSGRCLECGAWGTLASETVQSHHPSSREQSLKVLRGASGAPIIDLDKLTAIKMERWSTKMPEIDRVLGGGLVPGSLILLSGEPGIGKSTMVAQIANALAKNTERPVLYVSGEESAVQVKGRLERLNCDLKRIKFVSETNVEKILATILKVMPVLVIIDSIQTVYSDQVPSESGSLNQIRATASKFLELAKGQEIAVILIGHITKDGQIAGPKSLEHIVDTVIYLEQETVNNYSILRVAKNRFGSVNELGVFEMTSSGFQEVLNPSLVFLDQTTNHLTGSVIGCLLEGTRAFLVDIQALVTKTVFGYPQRKASGFDLNRLQVLTAVLSKKQKFNFLTQDVILNVVGGLKISDPALDLAVCLAMISSLLNKSLSRQLLVLGEVGLGGEVRPVSKLDLRLQEAEKLGLTEALIPEMKLDKPERFKKLKIRMVKNISEAVKLVF